MKTDLNLFSVTDVNMVISSVCILFLYPSHSDSSVDDFGCARKVTLWALQCY